MFIWLKNVSQLASFETWYDIMKTFESSNLMFSENKDLTRCNTLNYWIPNSTFNNGKGIQILGNPNQHWGSCTFTYLPLIIFIWLLIVLCDSMKNLGWSYWQGPSLSIIPYWQGPSLSIISYWKGQSLSIMLYRQGPCPCQ